MGLPNSVGNASANIIALDKYLQPRLPGSIWLGQGKGEPNWVKNKNGEWVDLNKEHSSGNAQDFIIVAHVGMVPTLAQLAVAWKLVNWFIKNARVINLRWIIFGKDQDGWAWSWNPDRGTWKRLYTGGVSEAHTDHIHVYLGGGDQDFSAIDNSPLEGTETEEDEVNIEQLHAELNNNEMISELTSRTGQVATKLGEATALIDVTAQRTGMVVNEIQALTRVIQQLVDELRRSGS